MFTKTNKKRHYLIFLLTPFLLITLHYSGLLSWLETGIQLTMSRILSQTHAFSVKLQTNKLFSEKKFSCVTEAEQILVEQKKNEIALANLKILEQENAELKKMLNFQQTNSNWQIVTAAVVSKNIENTDRIIAVALGLKDNIQIGQPVIADDGILIGKIFRVDQTISWVRLLNDSRSKVAAMILNETNSQGVVEGGYGLSVNMNFIPRNETVKIGEVVVTSGLDPVIPKGLLIGHIAAVINEAYQPFQTSILKPVLDYTKVMNVAVIISP